MTMIMTILCAIIMIIMFIRAIKAIMIITIIITLHQIFVRLDVRSLILCRAVCRRWAALVNRSTILMRTMMLIKALVDKSTILMRTMIKICSLHCLQFRVGIKNFSL